MAEENPFDHLIQRDELDEVERLLAQKRATPKLTSKAKKEKQKSLMEMLVGSNNQADLARKFNVDPDMSDKVLVPVLNFLDKYGVGDSISTSPTAQTAGSLIEFLTDVTPVVKNAMEYFAGKQKELSDEDRDFLNQIKEAQSTGDMGLFIGETLEPEAEATPEPEVKPMPKPRATNEGIPVNRDIFSEGVDWEEAMGIQPSQEEEYNAEVHNTFMTVGLERLAAEAGMDMDQIRGSDRQLKTNNFGRTSNAIDYTKGDGISLDLGLEKINEAMKMEKQKISHTSKVTFKDSDKMPVPTNLEGDSNPMNGGVRQTPSFAGFLEPVDLTILETEETVEAPWEEEEFNPSDFDEVVSYPTQEELEAEIIDEGVVENDVGEEE